VNRAYGVLFPSTGQSPEAEDSAKIDEHVDALVEELSALGVVEVPDVDDIEAAHFIALSELLANAVAYHFSLPPNPGMIEDAKERLRVMTRRGGVSDNKLTPDIALTAPRGLSLARWRNGSF
jgi:hypothetical protein